MDESIKKSVYPRIDFDFDDLSTMDDGTFDVVEDTLRNASSVGNATQAGLQTTSLQAAIDGYAQAMNQSAIAKSTGIPVKTPSSTYKGFAAEEYFKQTLKINALAKGVPDFKFGIYTKGPLPDGSNLSGIDMETDISVWTRKRPWNNPTRSVDYQSKMYNDQSKYQKLQSNPKYEKVELVGAAENNVVNNAVRTDIGNKTIASDSISNEEAIALADSMKAQETPKYQKTSEKHSELNRVNLGRAVAAGALTGFALTAVKEIVDVIKNRDHLPEDQFIESVTQILCGTAEGGIRGGAIMGSVQLLGKVIGKEVAANSLGAMPVMAAANTSVDFAKDLYRCFVTGTIDADDLLCNTINNTFSSVAGFGGAYVGAQIAGITSAKTAATTGAAIGSALGPIGTIVGSAVGGIIIGYGANAIVGTASKDAQKAFNECVAEINAYIEVSGCAKLYYFADSMSSISDFRLSFKDLLPCYNLISDLKEYNLHKKAIRSIHEQLDTSLESINREMAGVLQKLEVEHRVRLKELQARFSDQREAMFDEFKESMNTYVANSYSQYIGLFDVLNGNVDVIKEKLDRKLTTYNSILDFVRNRNKVNAQLNDTLAEIISDSDSIYLLKPLVEKLALFMQQDDLMIGRQYLSLDQALFLVNGSLS